MISSIQNGVSDKLLNIITSSQHHNAYKKCPCHDQSRLQRFSVQVMAHFKYCRVKTNVQTVSEPHDLKMDFRSALLNQFYASIVIYIFSTIM